MTALAFAAGLLVVGYSTVLAAVVLAIAERGRS